MSVVKINVLSVPEGRGEVLEQRFASRAGEVEKVDGFESFELLRPTEGFDKYLVVTRWRDESSFEAWLNSQAFQKGHARAGGAADATPSDATPSHADDTDADGAHPGGQAAKPAATGSEVWGFEIVTSAVKEP